MAQCRVNCIFCCMVCVCVWWWWWCVWGGGDHCAVRRWWMQGCSSGKRGGAERGMESERGKGNFHEWQTCMVRVLRAEHKAYVARIGGQKSVNLGEWTEASSGKSHQGSAMQRVGRGKVGSCGLRGSYSQVPAVPGRVAGCGTKPAGCRRRRRPRPAAAMAALLLHSLSTLHRTSTLPWLASAR